MNIWNYTLNSNIMLMLKIIIIIVHEYLFRLFKKTSIDTMLVIYLVPPWLLSGARIHTELPGILQSQWY